MNEKGEIEYQVTVRHCSETNNVIEETWRRNLDGLLCRHGGAPAHLVWDPHTCNLVLEEFWDAGGMHSPRRGSHPAQTTFDALTGEPTRKIWMRLGQKHRGDDLPAVEFLRNGKVLRHEYWLQGKLYRESGPPIVNFNPATGEIVSTAYRLEKQSPDFPRGYFPAPTPK